MIGIQHSPKHSKFEFTIYYFIWYKSYFNVTLNGQSTGNEYSKYPLIVYKDITYFSLTWRFAAEEFGRSYSEHIFLIEPNFLLSVSQRRVLILEFADYCHGLMFQLP